MQNASNEILEEENAEHCKLLKTNPEYRKSVEKEVLELLKKQKKHNLKTIRIDGGYEIQEVKLRSSSHD